MAVLSIWQFRYGSGLSSIELEFITPFAKAAYTDCKLTNVLVWHGRLLTDVNHDGTRSQRESARRLGMVNGGSCDPRGRAATDTSMVASMTG